MAQRCCRKRAESSGQEQIVRVVPRAEPDPHASHSRRPEGIGRPPMTGRRRAAYCGRVATHWIPASPHRWSGRLHRWEIVDLVVALLFALPAAAILINESRSPWELALSPLLLALSVAPMALRRRWPAGSVAFGVVAALLLRLVEPRAVVIGLLAVGYALYAAARSLRLGSALVALAAAILAAGATALPDRHHSGAAVLFSLTYALTWFIGFGVGMDRRHTQAMLAGQADLAAAEVTRAQSVVTEQRLEIARDLHDVVAHGITSITVQAAYARLILVEDPAAAQEAVAAIETVGRETLVELRQMLTVLRQRPDHGEVEGGQRGPSPTLSDLDQLVNRAEASGLRLDLTVTGTPGPIPAGVEAAAYRTVQEALTNVVKHARAEQATVAVHHGVDRLVLEVTDRGRGGPASIPFGYGLVGMRERAVLYGGSFEAGRSPAGGFRIVSTFPLPHATVECPVPPAGQAAAAS
jgi:signal transduction histidine kinase